MKQGGLPVTYKELNEILFDECEDSRGNAEGRGRGENLHALFISKFSQVIDKIICKIIRKMICKIKKGLCKIVILLQPLLFCFLKTNRCAIRFASFLN